MSSPESPKLQAASPKPQLRVALVNRFFHRAGAVPTVVREWADHLEAAGHEVVVFASDVDATRSTARRTYVPVRVGRIKAFDLAGFAFAWRLSKAMSDFGFRVSDFNPQSAVRDPQFDALFCTDSTAYFGAWWACRRLRAPAIMAFQGWIFNPGKQGVYPRTVTWVYKLSVRFCARHAPMIACINPEIHDGLRAMGAPEERLWLAPNCVDLGAWDTGKASAHQRAERQVLFVGRFSPEKGLRHLLEAMPLVLRRLPNVRAVVVGSDEAADGEYHALARRLGVAERVSFGGVVPRESLPKLYAEADILVVPSLAEGHPLAPIESLASGTPVVGSDLPGLRMTVEEGASGLLVPPGDTAALAEAICRVLGDTALLDRMTRAARGSAERFAWPRRVAELEALVARLRT